MKEKVLQSRKIVRFRQFQNDSYSAFRSLKVEVTIGVLSVAMLTFATPDSATAQVVTSSQSQEKLYELEEVEVTSSRAPLTLGQSARMVTVLDREAIAAAPAQSVNDLLKIAAGVDVRQRGPIGAQTDISVRGGTNEQITILLNGININDPQTGHNAADFPVDISEIERIEVLEGPAGRVYGTSSLVGAINIVTRKADKTSADVHLEAGSFGYVSGGGRVNLLRDKKDTIRLFHGLIYFFALQRYEKNLTLRKKMKKKCQKILFFKEFCVTLHVFSKYCVIFKKKLCR